MRNSTKKFLTTLCQSNAKNRHLTARREYYLNPSLCKECGRIIELPKNSTPSRIREKSFCNSSCAAKFTNRKRVHDCPESYRPKIFIELICKQCSICFKVLKRFASRRKFCSGKCRTQWNKSIKGPIHPCWKGGPNTISRGFYNSPEWHTLRTNVFIRDAYTCKYCKRVGGSLNAHHIKPRKKFPELSLVMNNIETVCIQCHRKIHKGYL